MPDLSDFSMVNNLQCRERERENQIMEERRNSVIWQLRNKCYKHVSTALLYEGNRSSNLNVSLVHDSCKNNFRVTLTCDSRDAQIRLRFSGPEVFLVTLRPTHATVFEGELQLKFPEKIHSYTIEAFVLFVEWNHTNISSNHLLTNSTSYFKISESRIHENGDSIPRHTSEIKWIVKSDIMADSLQCTKKPDRPEWCLPMPVDLWTRYFDSWYVPTMNKGDIEIFPQREVSLSEWRELEDHGKHVCFFGDSQMRHLFNNFIMLTSNYTARSTKPGEKTVIETDRHTYFEKKWGGFGEDSTKMAEKCTDIIANIGQWPAGWPEGYPWSFEVYESFVKSDMMYLKALSQANKCQVYWVSTNPHGYIELMFKNEEWRNEVVIDTYNSIAKMQAQSILVEYIDLYPIVKPLQDLAYDGAHFMGIIGDELARGLFDTLLRANKGMKNSLQY